MQSIIQKIQSLDGEVIVRGIIAVTVGVLFFVKFLSKKLKRSSPGTIKIELPYEFQGYVTVHKRKDTSNIVIDDIRKECDCDIGAEEIIDKEDKGN